MWRFPPRRVVVAVDFGDASAAAARLAATVARAFEARLTAVHADAVEAAADFTSRSVATFVERLAGMPARAVVSDAPPADAILEAARDADLLVMGTHGRRGPARWLAGSVAERVVREANLPVLVVHAARGVPAAPFRSIHVVAAPGTFDGPAKRCARGLAAALGGEVAPDTLTSVQDARTAGASLVVIARPSRESLPWLTDVAGDALRTHHGLMLFVPGT